MAGLAALVAGGVALGLGAVGAQVARLAAVEALAVQRPLLARHLARGGDMADLAAVVAGDTAAAGVAAAGREVGHAGAQGVHVAILRAVALQVAGLAALVARLGSPAATAAAAAATAAAAAAALRAVALQVAHLAADVASLGVQRRDATADLSLANKLMFSLWC